MSGYFLMIIRSKLFSFVADFLTSQGAAVEFDGENLVSLLPPQLAENLAVDEELILTPSLSSEGHILTHGTPFLDELLELTQKDGFFGHIELSELNTRSGGLRNDLLKTVRLIDGKGEIDQITQGIGSYLIVHYRFLATSDNLQKGGMLSFACNEETLVETPWLLQHLNNQKFKQVSPPSWRSSFDELNSFLHWRIEEKLKEELTPFTQKVHHRISRQKRQLERLHRRERKELLKMAKETQELDEHLISQQLQQMQDQYIQKTLQIPQQFPIDIQYEPFAFLRVSMPITRIRYSIQRRKQQRLISWIWNPLIEHFEPRACERTGRETYQIIVNNEMKLFAPSF